MSESLWNKYDISCKSPEVLVSIIIIFYYHYYYYYAPSSIDPGDKN